MLLAVMMAEVADAGADTVTGASLEQAAERDARVAALVVVLADARDARPPWEHCRGISEGEDTSYQDCEAIRPSIQPRS